MKPSKALNRKGNSNFSSFWKLTRRMAASQAFRSLSGSGVKVLVELHTRHNGFNNGSITLSTGEAAQVVGIGKSTAHRALKELQTKGFIKRMRIGTFYGRRASEWAVTDERLNGNPPTNDWKRYQPQKKAGRASQASNAQTSTPNRGRSSTASASAQSQPSSKLGSASGSGSSGTPMGLASLDDGPEERRLRRLEQESKTDSDRHNADEKAA